MAVLTLLSLSSAFGTIECCILLHKLRFPYGISGTVLSWFEPYLTGRTQTVTVNDQSARPAGVSFGVPHGSVLGPILFIVYSALLSSLKPILSPVSLLPMTHNYATLVLLIRYTPLS